MSSFFNRRFLALAMLCCAFQIMATGPAAASAPQAPSNVMASDGIYGDKVIINWDTVPEAEKYVILRSERPVSRGGVMTRLAILSRTYYEDTPPECGIIYYYWVRAINDDGRSRFSHAKGSCGIAGTEPMTGTLQTPENVSATDGDFTDKIRITWDRSSGAASYDIYRAEDFSAPKTRLGSTTGTTFDDTTADCCIDYYYWVKAKKGGETSDFFYSDIGYRDCPVSAPTNVNASDGAQEDAILVTWEASTGATSYDIYRATSPTGSKSKIADTTETTYTDTRITCDDAYFYWVQALNLCSNSEYSNSDSGYPKCLVPPDGDTPGSGPVHSGAPSAPTGVSASSGLYTDRIVISWQALPDATSYDIYRSARHAGVKEKISSTRGTSHSDRGIPVSTVFYYWVKAKNATGESQFSNFDSGYRLCPPAPTGPVASKDTYIDRIRITWGASKGALEYDVYRAIFPTISKGMRTKIATVKGTSYDDMFEPCVVNCFSCSTSSNKPFYYWVTARSADCTSPFSNTDSGYIHCKPAVPTGVDASDGGFANNIQVKWNATSDENLFEIWRSTEIDGPKTKMATTPNPAFNDVTVTCDTIYYYYVRRIDKKGIAGDFSEYDSGYSSCN
jgi:fibronectin type 3 domain-containing protein